MTKNKEQQNQEQQSVENIEGQNVNISLETILASILKNIGKTTVPVADLLTVYTDKQIAVNQDDEGKVSFELVDAVVPAEEPVVEQEN